MESQGINLDFLNTTRGECERSDRIILIKNLPILITNEKLNDLFSHYGEI